MSSGVKRYRRTDLEKEDEEDEFWKLAQEDSNDDDSNDSSNQHSNKKNMVNEKPCESIELEKRLVLLDFVVCIIDHLMLL